MSIKDVLTEDMKRALKEGEKEKLSVIRMARAAILNEEKDRLHELDDSEVIEVLSREVKKLRENKEEYERLNRPDVAAQLEREIDILLSYLPQQLTEEEIEEIARQVIYEIGANSIKDMGRVMTAIMPKVKGRADGRVVNQIVKKLLG
ncbi:GatB/YqeY domain-containing protein [Thermovenabulum sp.]|uniref:GatB/YqeY domain-containing protein n=1 Tax=Thermovenabulum sp. TaxID=3100335 RepID=UPI003C7B283B